MAKNVYASKLRFDDNERWLRTDGKAAKAENKVNRARRRAHYAAVFREESTVNVSGMPVTFTTESMEKSRFGKILQQHGRNMQKVYSINRQMLNSIEESTDGDLSMDALRTVNETLDTLARRTHNKSVKRDNRLVKRTRKLDKANCRNVASHIRDSDNVKGEYVYRQENGRATVSKNNDGSSMSARYSDQSSMFQSSSNSNSVSQPNTSNARQKKQIKREYAKQKRDNIRGSSSSWSIDYSISGSSRNGRRTTANGNSGSSKKSKAKIVLMISSAAVILLIFFPMMGFGGVGGAVSGAAFSAGQYPASEESILASEEYYCDKEYSLHNALEAFEEGEETSGYDEYIYELDSIEHDPYVLISMISAFRNGEEWVFNEEIKMLLDEIFERQYTLTTDVITETRTRTELQLDPNTGEEIEVEVEYEYRTCTVKLENFNLSHLPVHMMNEEVLSYYALYMSTLGCMETLFPDSRYVDLYVTNPPEPYSVDPAYFSSPTFAAIITEAEKYLGYPYVWGGYNPNTSFDCSGYVSWVINQCGWNVGRLGAQGLYGICSPIRKDQALPGDLIFFTGTYDAEYPVTHVGIYVGHGMMIHCGDPIQYASFETPYFQQHYYSMGRLPAQGG